MLNRTRVYGLTCLFLLAAVAAGATTIVMPTDEQLIAKSPVIVEGTVLSSQAVDRGGVIWTETRLAVAKTLKGSAREEITLAHPGGELGERITMIYGTPELTAGERVLLFLEQTPRGDYRTMDLFVGKFSEGTMADGRRLWLRTDAGDHVTLLDADFQPLRARNIQRDAARFDTFVAERVAGRGGEANYGIENPVLAKGPKMRTEFSLISEPTVYRWAQFDSGTTVQWYSNGTQAGYTNGGVSEIQTAMSAWTGYSAAKILYAYAGARTGTPGGLDGRNGVNEILFNDPLNEIAGTWNRSAGGVVGQGGFNGSSGGGNWTAPFAADAAHPAGSIRVYNIVEGGLTIQDGVSPSTGMSSNRLAEIISHEFGHTLGFGHTPDNSALMFASVTGIGPQLRADDQLAARWLYPNGTPSGPSTPTGTTPAAPSSLSASVSGSSITLAWNDNASNESTQYIYLAVGNGGFVRTTEVGANVRIANINGLNAGTYRLYVTASNNTGESAGSNTVTATVQAQLRPGFTVSMAEPTTNDTIAFRDTTTGAVTSWYWTFGDGGFSSDQHPTHRYERAGAYTVTLNVSRNTESASIQKTVVVVNAAPAQPAVQAAFSISATSPVTGSVVAFTDQSSGTPSSWSWTFGDGGTSSLRNPTHVYNTPGLYTVTLTTWNGSTSSVATKQISVTNLATFESLVSATAQTNGVGGTTWRTELSLFNAGEWASVDLIFIPSGGGSIQTRTVALPARQSTTYANALLDLYGVSSGIGAIAIRGTGTAATPQLKVTSRTFTGGALGTYGQGVPDVQSAALAQMLYLTGMQSNAGYRTNVGLVNRKDTEIAATLALFDADGFTVATANMTIAPLSFQQSSLAGLFPSVNGRSFDTLSMRISSASADAVSAYASIVDNRTQDPVYVQAIPAPVGTSLVLPVVGRAPGANGTFWRSDAVFFNPRGDRLQLTVRFNNAPLTIFLEPGRTTTISDVLAEYGLTSASGALEVSWNGGTGPVVTSRTYTTAANGGTFGQSIDPVTTFAHDVYVPGLQMTAGYRSNVGFVNGGTEALSVEVSLVAPTGAELVRTSIALPSKSQSQYSIAGLFPGVTGTFTLRATTAAGAKLFAYGSMVDNTSGDPVFFAGR